MGLSVLSYLMLFRDHTKIKVLDTLLNSNKRRGVSNAVFIQRRRLLQNRISEITNNDYGKSFVNITKTGGHTFKFPMSYFFTKIEL